MREPSYPLNRKLLKVHRVGVSLAAKMLTDRQLDVCIETGAVTSYLGNVEGRRMTVRPDEDGYHYVHLARERKRGKKNTEGRRRERMKCFIHRLVVIKKLAMERAAKLSGDWRDHVKDLPGAHDVDHIDFDRSNNHHENLRCIGQAFNRKRYQKNAEDDRQTHFEEDF